MSATATEATTLASDASPSVPGSADGSHPGGSADSEHNAGAGQQGSESTVDEGQDEGGAGDARPSEIESLKAQLASEQGRRQELDKFLHTLITPQGQGDQGEDPLVAAAKELFAESHQPGFVKYGRTVIDRAKAEILAELGGELGSLRQAVAGNAFDRALDDRGIDAETRRSPEWKTYVKDLEERRKSFRPQQQRFPEDAADAAVDGWKLRATTRTTNAAERLRIERARGATLNGAAPRGSGTVIPVLTLGANDEDKLSKMSAHLKQHGEGQNPTDFFKKYVKQIPVT